MSRAEDISNSSLTIEDSDSKKSYEIGEVLDKIVLGDALHVLQKFPSECVDLAFLDPPYFLQLPKRKLKRWSVKSDVEGVDDEWDKFNSFREYDEFISGLLRQLRRVMKPSATIWVIATYHSIFRIGKLMQDLGFWVLNDVHWIKTNPMPNWLGVRFTNATETLIWAVKDRNVKDYAFDRDAAREAGIGKIGANVWVLPICSGKERMRAGDGKKLHSTQKPVELLRRIILTSSREGDIVLDPAAGTGTSGFVARELGRRFIMIDVNPAYAAGMEARMQQHAQFKDFGDSEARIRKYFKLK